MSRGEWIVCERAPRWAPALRIALAESGSTAHICELRSLSELEEELAARPHAVAAIEIQRGNFGPVLGWLPAARKRHASAVFAALLDGAIAGDADLVAAALLEASAQAVATSPRRLEAVLALAKNQARLSGKSRLRTTALEEVWASLPWQAS